MIGAAYVYEVVAEKLGDKADEWLDTSITDLAVSDASTQIDAQTPREALESGCPGCIDGVYQLAVKL